MTGKKQMITRRQVWQSATPTSASVPHTCSPYRLPSAGVLNLGNENFLTLTNDAVFQPSCTGVNNAHPADPLETDVNNVSVLNINAPFYTSTDPQMYATAAVTISSYMLVLILFITPRTYYIGGTGGGVSLFGQTATHTGQNLGNHIIGIGSRPWLQKLAAITLAVSLTIVTADTFKWAERMYYEGYQDAAELASKVQNSLEVKIVMLISETFLWLAQAQTLIRLFQRHREKLVIKWTAFILITLEIIFSILNRFVDTGSSAHHPRGYESSIPALNYLFSLSLDICYAAFVIVYSLRKRRFAYFHPQMHSMPLMALLSLTAIFIPVVFFILDLSKPNVSNWGNYVRWVGACAASVVVWEWVERIEALEREEKKGGILGREIFDGDEMLEVSPPSDNSGSDNASTPSPRQQRDRRLHTKAFSTGVNKISQLARRVGGGTKKNAVVSVALKEVSSESSRSSDRGDEADDDDAAGKARHTQGQGDYGDVVTDAMAPPLPAQSPFNRSDTASAASTVYMIRYHPQSKPTPPIAENPQAEREEEARAAAGTTVARPAARDESSKSARAVTTVDPAAQVPSASFSRNLPHLSRLSRLAQPFKHHRHSPPAEVAAAIANQEDGTHTDEAPRDAAFAHPDAASASKAGLSSRFQLRKESRPVNTAKGIVFVPAAPRRRTSSALANEVHPSDGGEWVNDDDAEQEQRIGADEHSVRGEYPGTLDTEFDYNEIFTSESPFEVQQALRRVNNSLSPGVQGQSASPLHSPFGSTTYPVNSPSAVGPGGVNGSGSNTRQASVARSQGSVARQGSGARQASSGGGCGGGGVRQGSFSTPTPPIQSGSPGSPILVESSRTFPDRQ